MALGEFDLIARCFSRPVRRAVLGGGDDGALLQVRSGMHLVVTSDMLVEGRHFLPTVPPQRLGHKALAVNLSDLAAMGADPLAFTLALALPHSDEAWAQALADGLYALADRHGIELVGGDTTAGPLNLCITAFGEVPAGQALRRDGARAGHDLWVSHPPGGGLGDARLALEAWRGRVLLDAPAFAACRDAMELPEPRVALGRALRGVASAALDLSDGLVGDLAHLLARSGVGATVEVDALPRSVHLAAQPIALQRLCGLSGGDDYELLFAAPAEAAAAVQAAAASAGCAATRIGRLDAAAGVRLLDRDGRPIDAAGFHAFDHFRAP